MIVFRLCDRSTSSSLPVASDHTNTESDVNNTILSTTESQFEVQQNTTETSEIDISEEISSEVAFIMKEVSLNLYKEDGTSEIEELSTISSNNSTQLITTAVPTVQYNTTEKAPIMEVKTLKMFYRLSWSLISGILNIPRVMQNALMKLSNLKYV